MARYDKTIVVHNDLREAPMRELTAREHNLMWTVLYSLKDKNIEEVKEHGRTTVLVPYTDVADMANLSRRGLKDLREEARALMDKMASFRVHYSTEKAEGTIIPFPVIRVEFDKPYMEVVVMAEFAYIVNFALARGNFSKLKLAEVNGLRSKYSKIAYYFLSTYKNTGVWSIDIEEFREVMGFSKDLRPSEIRKRVLAPICEELPEFFPGLQVYEKLGKQNRLERLIFEFAPAKYDLRGEVKRQEQLKRLGEGSWHKMLEAGSAFLGDEDILPF